MVGRDRELARVMLLLDDALAGGGRLVLCTGEAGIGKTRLAEEAAASAAARGVPVAWAWAADAGSLPPYGLWQLVLDEPALRAAGDDPSGPGLWSRVFSAAERPALADGADSGSAQRFAMFAEVRRRLAQAARPNGLLLVLDDLQWVDEASAVLLADVVRQLRGTVILVLATYREPAADTSAGLLPRLSADASTERVDLGGLPAGAVGDMLLAAGLPASAEAADQVHSETGGNPFLVRELARMLTEQRRGGSGGPGGPGGPDGSVPGRVAEATAHRLAQLSDPARALVQTAAVAGNNFSAGVVAAILDVPVLALLGPLDECRAAGFLVAGDRPGDHRFSHALVRSAVAARLNAAEQRRLHAAAADAIEALYEGQLELHLAEVARHRVEASLPGDRTDAVAACEAAAEVAAQSLAFEEAVRLYRQALSVGEGEIGENDRSRLELALAEALHRSGDLPGSQETAARVGRRAERRRDRGLLARTALVMEASGVPEWDGEICRICEQALAGDDLPDGLRTRVSSRYAQALVYRGEYDRAGQVSRDALAAAGSARDPVALVDALRARQLACCAPDGVAERAVLASRMLEAADAAGSAWLELWGRLWRIDTLFETGQLRNVRRELADLEGCVERLPGPLARLHFVEASATLALATGRFTEANELAWQAYKVFTDMGHPVAFGGCSAILGQAGLHIGFGRSGLIELWERRRARDLHGPGRAAARPGGRRAGPSRPGGRGPADGGHDLRHQRRPRLRGASPGRTRRRAHPPAGARRPGRGAGRAGRRRARGRTTRDGPVHRVDRTAASPADGRAGRRLTPQPPRARGGPAGRAGTDEQADRPEAVRLRADGREPRPAHLDQARAPQPQPDRRLGQRRARREPPMSTQADRE